MPHAQPAEVREAYVKAQRLSAVPQVFVRRSDVFPAGKTASPGRENLFVTDKQNISDRKPSPNVAATRPAPCITRKKTVDNESQKK